MQLKLCLKCMLCTSKKVAKMKYYSSVASKMSNIIDSLQPDKYEHLPETILHCMLIAKAAKFVCQITSSM